MRQMDEESLARLCSEHNRMAEDELYMRYAGKIYALCLRYCNSDDDAQDLMQECFIKVFQSIKLYTFKGEGSLYAWIKRIAVNMALNELKRRQCRFISFETFGGNVIDNSKKDIAMDISEDVMLRMIAELPAMKRVVFNMYCIDGYSHREIASKLCITEKGSASILSKAKSQIKKKIKEYINQMERK